MERSDSSIGEQYNTISEEHHNIHTCSGSTDGLDGRYISQQATGMLPSNTEKNPKEQANTITLRSGR